MSYFRYLLIIFFFFTSKANGQESMSIKNVIGKKFVSKQLEYLEIINDTTLYSSINSYNDTALFFLRNDSFSIRQAYHWTDGSGSGYTIKYYNYKLVFLTNDTICLENNYRFNTKPTNWEDTLVFINIENLKESITDFRYLKLDCSSPWSGRQHIKIDNLGKVSFIADPILYSRDNPSADKNARPENINGQLSKNEFFKFKEILSMSLLSRLPSERDCPMDGTICTFEIVIGERKYKSSGCDLSWTHTSLLNYLYNIRENKEFRKITK